MNLESQYFMFNKQTIMNTFTIILILNFSILDSMVARFMRPWLHIDFLYKWTNSYKTDQKHLNNIRYFTNRVSLLNFDFGFSIDFSNFATKTNRIAACFRFLMKEPNYI